MLPLFLPLLQQLFNNCVAVWDRCYEVSAHQEGFEYVGDARAEIFFRAKHVMEAKLSSHQIIMGVTELRQQGGLGEVVGHQVESEGASLIIPPALVLLQALLAEISGNHILSIRELPLFDVLPAAAPHIENVEQLDLVAGLLEIQAGGDFISDQGGVLIDQNRLHPVVHRQCFISLGYSSLDLILALVHFVVIIFPYVVLVLIQLLHLLIFYIYY